MWKYASKARHQTLCSLQTLAAYAQCRPVKLDFYKLIYIKEEKHPYAYSRLQTTCIYFEKQQITYIKPLFYFRGFIHILYWFVQIYVFITFLKHCRFSSIFMKTRPVREWSAEDGFSDYQATSQQHFCYKKVYNQKEIDGTSILCSSFHVECHKCLN